MPTRKIPSHRQANSAPRQARAFAANDKIPLLKYLGSLRLRHVLIAPLVYVMIVPIMFMDLCTYLYTRICFPVWGLPHVKRTAYLIFDRQRLPYLNAIQKLNCIYCGYANGVIAYVQEIAGRTEEYFCPIKHAVDIRSKHSRYDAFAEYGDAESFFKTFRKTQRPPRG